MQRWLRILQQTCKTVFASPPTTIVAGGGEFGEKYTTPLHSILNIREYETELFNTYFVELGYVEFVEKYLYEVVDIRVSNVDKKIYPDKSIVKLCNYMDAYSNDYISSKISFSFWICWYKWNSEVQVERRWCRYNKRLWNSRGTLQSHLLLSRI